MRQGSPASDFVFVMAFDPIFRWLHNSVIPWHPAVPEFLQLVPCADADDSAVPISSFRSLMPALSPAFMAVDCTAGLNLHHRKCYWVEYGNDSCQDLLDWVSTRSEAFREMKIEHAKCVCTMVGPEVISIDGLHCVKTSLYDIGKSTRHSKV